MDQLNQIEEIRRIANELIQNKRIKINSLANYLGLEERQYSSFYKFIKGYPFPQYLEIVSEKILEKLNKLLEGPDRSENLKEPWPDRIKSFNEITSISDKVWIPFDLKLPVIEYKGTVPPLSVIQIGTKKGLVIFRNTSPYVADGEFYIDDIGMITDIEPGMKLAIKRINKRDWKSDRYYVIIDASDQIGIWELLAGDSDENVRLVSNISSENYKIILLERIQAIFSIVVGTCIPRPKRDTIIASLSQK